MELLLYLQWSPVGVPVVVYVRSGGYIIVPSATSGI